MALDVIVVQHGEKERLPGDPGLTQRGRLQARATADWLASTEPTVGVVVTSPLRRARETAEEIARALGVALTMDPRLRERLNWDGPDRQTVESFLADWAHTTDDRDFVPTSGDSSRRAGARFVAALDDLAGRHAGETVLVVTHGGITADLLRDLVGDAELRRVAPGLVADGVPSCAMTRLVHSDHGWSVLGMGSTAHLEPPPPRPMEIIVRAVIRRDGHLLLARQRGQSWSSLPGGHLEAGETLQACLVREIAEELGADAVVTRFAGAVEHRYAIGDVARHEINFVFEAALAETVASSRERHLEFRWLPLTELADSDLRPNALRNALVAASFDAPPFWGGWND